MSRCVIPLWIFCGLMLFNQGWQAEAAAKPNIVLVVADDIGWRDAGYRGNDVVKTPHLDAMAANSLQFDYFYAGQQMCSCGRFAILSGRAPFRTGLYGLGKVRPEEIILPRALKTAGYRSAHFGKWHLGKGKSSPMAMGFDEAIWNENNFHKNRRLHVGDAKPFIEIQGDTSVAVMDMALEYIGKQVKRLQPFFVQVCFSAPHVPHMAAEEFKALYNDLPAEQQEFLGEISGLDAAVGKLRAELRELDIADNTIVWFTSDNGGLRVRGLESNDPTRKGKMSIGCRTQGLLEWPGRIKPRKTDLPCGHVDIYPTLLGITGARVPNQPMLDGISLVPLLDGKMEKRPKPLGFMLWRYWSGGGTGRRHLPTIDFVKDTQGVLIDGHYKLIVNPPWVKKKAEVELYDIFADPAETNDLAQAHSTVVTRMKQTLQDWQRSVRGGYDGADFGK